MMRNLEIIDAEEKRGGQEVDKLEKGHASIYQNGVKDGVCAWCVRCVCWGWWR